MGIRGCHLCLRQANLHPAHCGGARNGTFRSPTTGRIPLAIGIEYRILPFLAVGPSFQYEIVTGVGACMILVNPFRLTATSAATLTAASA